MRRARSPRRARKREPLDEEEFNRIVADLSALDILFPPPSDPMAVARKLMEGRTFAGLPTMLHWRNGWMRWEGPHWTEIEERTVRAECYQRLEQAEFMTPFGSIPWKPNRHKISDVLDALRAITHLPESYNPPCWLPSVSDSDSIMIATRMGYSMSALASSDRSRRDSSTWFRCHSRTTRTPRRPHAGWNSCTRCGPTMRSQLRRCGIGSATS